jgi:2-methylcitrate dehydratase
MGMHFKLGLYEHQSAGALQGLIDLIDANPDLLDKDKISRILIKAYEPAFGIIGDPAKRDPRTRQSADHSMVYIVATMLRKAIENRDLLSSRAGTDSVWKAVMLSPYDYSADAIQNRTTRELMAKIDFEHGGPEYDAKYPDGIPTSLVISDTAGNSYDSGFVMYPAGHARNTTADLAGILGHKFAMLGKIAAPEGDEIQPLIERFGNLRRLTAGEVASLYDFEIASRPGYE